MKSERYMTLDSLRQDDFVMETERRFDSVMLKMFCFYSRKYGIETERDFEIVTFLKKHKGTLIMLCFCRNREETC